MPTIHQETRDAQSHIEQKIFPKRNEMKELKNFGQQVSKDFSLLVSFMKKSP